MSKSIEVRVTGRGWVKGEEMAIDPGIVARCNACDRTSDLVVAITDDIFTCRDCLRARLDATSVASWRLGQPNATLPWGKNAG